ncbi:MAG: DUF4280 domain-containing protein [Hymenobacter sp.]|nr:MAG: DUF4280 domain-containing protein [Hymenobacter sp.]
MSQTGQEYVCHGAICRCDKGSLPSQLQVVANQTVHLQGKAVATTLDKLFVPFGTCALKYNTPCVPVLLLWQDYFDRVSLVAPGCHPLLDKSTIPCAIGGIVSIINTLQVSVPVPPPPAQAESVRASSMSLCPLLHNDDAA